MRKQLKYWSDSGSAIQPWKLLCLKIRTCNLGRLPNHEGKVSLMSFSPRSRNSSNPQLVNDFGHRRSSWLSVRLSSFSLQAFEKVWGMGSSSRLPPKFNTVKLALSCALIQTGICPLKLFIDRSKKNIEFALQISLGITPYNLFQETVNQEFSIWDSI